MKKRWFEKRLFFKFFLPALFSSLGLAIGGIADSLYIGRTLSDSGLFILGAASPIYMIFSTISLGIASGGAIHFASLLSEGREEKSNTVFSSVAIINFLVIALLSILGLIWIRPLVALLGCSEDMSAYGDMLSYVRLMLITAPILFMQAPLQYFVHTDNAPKLASAALVIGNICDCAFGFLFIVVLRSGVNGSIWSTVCGAVVMEGICLSHLIKGNGALKLKNMVMPNLKLAAQSFFTGFATAAQYLYQFVIVLAFNHILLSLGGAPMVAAYDITANAGTLVTAVIDAVVLAMIPLVSTFYGERNKDSMGQSMRLALVTGFFMTALFSGLMIVFSRAYCRFSGLSADSLAAGSYAMRMFMLSMPLACINSLIAAYLQNIEKEKLSYVIMGLRCFVVLLPCGLLLSRGGYKAFWLCCLVTEGVVFIGILLWILVSRLRGKPISEDFSGSHVFSETIIGFCAQISDTCERLQHFIEDNGASMKKALLVSLAVDETCRLIAENGEELMLQLTLVCENNEYVLHIRDNAKRSFNPFELDEDDERGLGLKIIRSQAKHFYYRRFVGYNTLTVVFEGEKQ